ncbi:DUF4139 domain-containing protein [Thermogemmata fonticola]|uniref:DUF4139 domain-containing protein n=1 Tax=Thermogemmata fonticola TaxID=2755323 RepID=A0A7V8VBG9_9BACT|nr:DUF4139 domain-containing protein [Thermogemmata fonticola]MBA2224983.1 DUF4139 domain-containing protein [Thermogemmata fonticola]
MTRWKKWALAAGIAAVGIASGAGLDRLTATTAAAPAAAQDLKPAVHLPITRVVLFNSGVGYFARSGEVTDDARVDLTFREEDINDLLKSMTLEDFGNGRIDAVSYDSREPIARTLASFAINLNGNPTFSGILTQMRGERVEVTLTPTAVNQPGKLNGVIVGVEKQKAPAGNTTIDVEVLNLWCAEGLRSVKLTEIQQLKFLNPVIESEFRRALEVLSLSHDTQKKAVSLYFSGQGKRKVQVGYVVEAPIWKTSYRLILDKDDKEAPYLQGWALVENPTDDDWENVRMVLVSGRPISFKMDLYNPLYVDRPTERLELFTSLRPVTYRGGFRQQDGQVAQGANRDKEMDFGLQGGGFGGGAGAPRAAAPAPPGMPAADRALKNAVEAKRDERFAREVGDELGRRLATGAVGSAATAANLGDYYQYIIQHPVTLARQKSGMFPIVTKHIQGQRVSIYNQNVQKTHPLRGLKFKNTSEAYLNQGPITVFEGSTYAGDTRILDVNKNEERLLSYAIDLGMEVDPQVGPGTQQITSVRAVKGIITTTTKFTEEKRYRIINRSEQDRVLLIEHPNRSNQQFRLVETDKPVEETPEFYRFQTSLKSGETKTFTVKEERDVRTTVQLSNSSDDQIRYFISLSQSSPALKQKLHEALTLKGQWDAVRRELQQVVADLQRLNADQDRIRKNLRETPPEAEVYKTYLKKLNDQEKEIDGLTAKQKELMAKEFAARKRYEDYLANLSD